MRIIACQLNTPEWLKARLSIPSASCAEKLITPAQLKPSKSADLYLARLCAEYVLGQPLDEASSGFMDRGHEMEAEAVRRYEFDRDVDTKAVGFCLHDTIDFGASPDRLVGEDGLLEVKCPAAATIMAYHLNPELLKADHLMQVQAQLWVTGRKWCDLWAYAPWLSVTLRIEPDPEVSAALSTHVPAFVARLDAAKAKLQPLKAARSTEAARAVAEAAASGDHDF